MPAHAEVSIRPAADSDANAVAHVHRLSRAWYYGTEPDPGDGRKSMWAQLIAQPGRRFLLAESGSQIVYERILGT
jgi:hypothetical protein